MIGWLNTRQFDATGDAAASQGWAPHVLDTNGNGKLDSWIEPNQPPDEKLDTRIAAGFYAVMPNPAALRSEDAAERDLYPAAAGLRRPRR